VGRRLLFGKAAGIAVVAVCLVLLAGQLAFATSDLNFFVDARVQIREPKELAQVSLPYVVRWDAHGLGAQDSFGVFIDRQPMPPGKDLNWFARNDDVCATDPACPNPQWLAERNIYMQRSRSLRLSQLVDTRVGGRGLDRHTVTVVVLDQHGRRVGESAWSRDFALVHGRGQ
jgi:hypothetical protein